MRRSATEHAIAMAIDKAVKELKPRLEGGATCGASELAKLANDAADLL